MSRPYHTRYTRKCHCAMCGRDDAGGPSRHRSYRAVGIVSDEHGMFGGDKRDARRLRRTRENRGWTAMLDKEVE